MSLILYLIMTAATFYMAVYYNSQSLFFVLLVLLLVPLFSSIIAAVAAIKTKAFISAGEDESGSFVNLKIINRSHLSAPCLRYKIFWQNNFGTFKKSVLAQTNVKAKGTTTIKIPITTSGCGVYRAKIQSCYGLDYFNFIPLITFKSKDISDILIMPKLTYLEIIIKASTTMFISESDEYHKDKKGQDYSEIYEVRPYLPGDKLSRIHWKISTSGNLMVKEGSLPLGCGVLIIADLRYADEDFFEGLFSFSATLCQKLCPHYLCWYSGGDVKREKILTIEDIYAVAAQIFLAQNCQGNYSIEKLYGHKYHAAETASTVKFSDSLFIDNKVVIKGKGFTKKLATTTIEI